MGISVLGDAFFFLCEHNRKPDVTRAKNSVFSVLVYFSYFLDVLGAC